MTISKLPPDSLQFPQTYHLIVEASEWLKEKGMKQWEEVPITQAEFKNASERNEVFVMMDDSSIMGTVTLTPNKDPYWGPTEGEALYLHRFVISRRYKGNNWGEKLLKWAETYTKDLGFDYVRLDCRDSNPVIKEYYSKHGYIFKGVGQGKFPFALFEKKLPS